jgi:AcrR family transcriptional regulator
VSRWQPNARGRLEQATLELFAERGYEQTTVAEIAGRAGLTERTFFRHFTDKREALFSGQGALEELLVNAVTAAPQAATPIDAVAAALAAAGAQFAQRREDLQLRQAIIATYPELRERELIKLASLAAALTGALRRRGVADSAAALTAEAGTAVLRIAVQRWLGQTSPDDLGNIIRDSLAELKAVAAGASG